jgi:hypothetical protein
MLQHYNIYSGNFRPSIALTTSTVLPTATSKKRRPFSALASSGYPTAP